MSPQGMVFPMKILTVRIQGHFPSQLASYDRGEDRQDIRQRTRRLMWP
jgi:hypothetical protein